ncbi:MAG: hypothetical protein ACRYGL_11130 [Janthinobacterium lividum]
MTADIAGLVALRRRREEAARAALRRAEDARAAAHREVEAAQARLAAQRREIDAEARQQRGTSMGRRCRMIELRRAAARLGALQARCLSLGEALVRSERHEQERRAEAETARKAWAALQLRCEKLEALQARRGSGRDEYAAMDGVYEE